MKRREFITVFGGAAVWLAARAQQAAMPVIAVLSAVPQEFSTSLIDAWRKGLAEIGFVEGRNVAIEFRFVSSGQYERLPGLAAELVKRPVGLIVAMGPPAALAAKIATTTIPIVFVVGPRFDQFGCTFVVGDVPQTRGTPSSRHNFLTLVEFMGVSVGVLALICALVLLVRDARSTETGLHLRLGLSRRSSCRCSSVDLAHVAAAHSPA